MDPTHCPYCGSADLAHARLLDGIHNGLIMGFFKRVGVWGAACLACGAVVPYLDDAALAKVRAWSGNAKPVKAPIEEV
jgi:hypothetical protein